MRRANAFNNLVPKGFIAGAKNIGPAHDGGLQDRIVVRVADDGWNNIRNLGQDAGRFQKSQVLLYGFFRQGPSGLNPRVAHHTLNLHQNGRREDKHMGSRDYSQEKIAGKALW
jgi:hypothetical protein